MKQINILTKNTSHEKIIFHFVIFSYRESSLCPEDSYRNCYQRRQFPVIRSNNYWKGTANKSTSGWEGKFSITTSSENAILSASLKGFRSQEIPTEGKTVVNITLFSTTPEKAQQINEVVITALGIKKNPAPSPIMYKSKRRWNCWRRTRKHSQ